ncbi:MAG TPA: amidohydrolase [Firmicutes bacterium]|nr:amidohydrolase [Bacillota bacterium]
MNNKLVKKYLVLMMIMALVLIATSCAQDTDTADLALINGSIYTMICTNDEVSTAEALVIKDGKIMAVGSNEDVEHFIGTDTEVIDLEGKMVLPGMIESHLHPPGSAFAELYCINLHGVLNEQDTMETIRQFIADNPDLDAYYGEGFSIGAFKDQEAALGPKKERLDQICPDKLVIIESLDGHISWVNSKALDAAGITRDTPDPPGGVIEKDPATGELWGTLKEAAKQSLPPQEFTFEQKMEALIAFQDFMHSLGYTGIFSAGMDQDFYEVFKALEESGELKLWVRASGGIDIRKEETLEQQVEQLIQLRDTYNSELFKVATAKIFVDGVIEGVTGYLLEPYSAEAGKGDNFYGLFYWDMEDLKKAVKMLNGEDFQVHVHAIGDAAVKNTLDAFEYARQETPGDFRNAITHLQLVALEDFARFKDLEVVASVQPYWHFKEPDWFEVVDYPFLGERAEYEYPLGSFFNAGVVVASSSDHSVTPYPNPLWAIEIGATRNLVDGESYDVEDITDMDDPTWLLNKNERASLMDMIKSFTINGAYMLFLDELTGTIEEGKYADLVILEQDLFQIDPLRIDSVQILKTIFQGLVVYEAES